MVERCITINSRNRILKVAIEIDYRGPTKAFDFRLKIGVLLAKHVVLKMELLNFLEPLNAALTASAKCRDRNKKARDKKAGGKSQSKWYESLKESGVTHILHLLKTSGINYGGSENSVSPRLSFYLNSFGGCRKGFQK